MSSTVTSISSTIDTNFPAFGQAESLAGGFQSNFKKISDSFDLLSRDVNTYLNQTFRKDDSNDFGGNVLKNTVFQSHAYRVNDLGQVVNGTVTLNYREGAYHKCTVNSGYYTFNFVNWNQRNTYSKVRLQVYNQSTGTTSSFFIGFSGKVRYFGTPTTQINLTGESSVFYDVWTTDGGASINVKPIGSVSSEDPIYYSGGGGGGGGGSEPTITSVFPEAIGAFLPNFVTINGTNFIKPIVVKLGGIDVTTSTASPTQLGFFSPAWTPGFPASLSVTTPNGTTATVVYFYDDVGGGV